MMRHWCIVFLSTFTLCLVGCGGDNMTTLSSNSVVDQSTLAGYECPAYLSETELPEITQFELGEFDHWGNHFMANIANKPSYHFAKDLIMVQGEQATLQAKFDYGSVFHKDLEDEVVEGYLFHPELDQWRFLGSFRTNYDGKVYIDISGLNAGEYAIKLIVKGDGSSASGRITVVSPQQKSVVFDLDSTLTETDLAVLGDYLAGQAPATRAGAIDLVNLYSQLGYRIIYLTVRPYVLIPVTQTWFERVGLPRGHLYSPVYVGESLNVGAHADFKAGYLDFLLSEVELDIVAAYGNSKSDIEAYERAGLDKERTFIVGNQGGRANTVDLGSQFTEHLTEAKNQVQPIGCSPGDDEGESLAITQF
jgi:phosphatidate phosphatase PAH1